ncbi:MAG: class II glutamine amidotransferase, partial [Ruminococcus sp.]|nr:class II glutamine amidotransferase [Ruminococcus sp.]
MMNSIHEECGVFGIYSTADDDLAALTYYGLYALQHRGQESAGIALNDDGVFRCIKGEGLVSEVFSGDKLRSLGTGHIAVGHVRYATTGSNAAQNIQPLLINHHKGRMALCHNGNLSNSYLLRTQLEENGAIFHTTTDSEVISYMVVQERLRHSSIEDAVSAAMESIEGAYSLVICSPQKLIAVRDPHGFRPLCYGVTDNGSVVFA